MPAFALCIAALQRKLIIWLIVEAQLFTGLVEEIGTVVAIRADQENAKTFSIRSTKVYQDAQVGDSISINGCCLTMIRIKSDVFDFQAGSETLGRTNLKRLDVGDRVNLERALKAGDRLGGHYVSGHVDGVGKIDLRTDDNDWSEFWFSVPHELTAQMASKGSVAVDGVSLTLVAVQDEKFSVALIPHTLTETTLGDRQIGDEVNIETDILAKYVQQQLNRMNLDKQ